MSAMTTIDKLRHGQVVDKRTRAREAAEFYNLRSDAEDDREYELMLEEIGQLLELTDSWPGRRGPQTFRVLESVAETFTGSPDPYRLLMRYRQVRAAAPRRPVRSIQDLRWQPSEASPWSEFDVAEYVRRNYFAERKDGYWSPETRTWQPGRTRNRIIKHDQVLIDNIYQLFAEFGARPGEFTSAIDIGSGGNLYPAMTLVPMIDSAGIITRQVYSNSSGEAEYAAKMHDARGDGMYRYTDRFGIERSADTRKPWPAFEKLIKQAGSEAYPGLSERFRGTMQAALARSEVVHGDIFDFADPDAISQRFDLVTAFYVHDSISFDTKVAWKAVDCIFNAAAKFAVVGQVLNRAMDGGCGAGYTAGGGTLFPNTAYSRDEWNDFLRRHPRVRNHKIVESRDEPDSVEQFSDGEDGLALIMVELKPLA